MADGFIIKRGSQGGTKQVESLDTNGFAYSPTIVLNNYLIEGIPFSSIDKLEDVKYGGERYNES